MQTIYGTGQGGKHRNNYDARQWRELSTNIRKQLEKVFYQKSPALARKAADDWTRLTVRELNRLEVERTVRS